MSFQITVVTPEQQILDETVTAAVIPAHDGKMGILTDRAPLLVKLGKGELSIDLAGGRKRTIQIEGGVAQMRANKLTVLTEKASAVA